MTLRLRPSLTGRVVLALLCAFALVWAALVARDFVGYLAYDDDPSPLGTLAEAVLQSLESLDDASARIALAASDRQYNLLRRQSLPTEPRPLMFLAARVGQPSVYRSPGLAGAHESCDGTPARTEVEHAGQRYWRAERSAGGWCVVALEPVLEAGTVIRLINATLLQPMAIALPLILLPLWLTVRSGLAPLRRFADRIRRRAPDDLSPLDVDLRHAELAPLGEAFDALLARARASIERERSFVQDAAHELRTPLAVIAAEAHALTGATDAAARQRAQRGLEAAVARASHLVGQLLRLASLESRGDGSPPAICDVAALLREVLIAALPAATARRVDIGLDGPDALLAHLDAGALHSVVDNLVRNAVAYGREGGRVDIVLRLIGDTLQLDVADDGPGLDPALQPHLFERFRRGAGTSAPGAGLGLAIVREAVRRLGGHIALTAGLDGQGTGFRITVPFVASRPT
ncbi:Sensor protein [Methyloversatilis universalis FAM5]|uniref:histidine kinase n=1 Tax=Methyloversatilis universalis (strain ATCC BAA-1314 / DSM 25237 / JCM 13912 / CCUG 52030 / FAM5) TaxID=1000565 RepID=F5RCG3_METUF|nr:HAMP domain-containing sensor histidine kinase [Methyloversatilis universalis]EGK71746.1 Sensor protein [Methyloversatilis universalis FAM5]